MELALETETRGGKQGRIADNLTRLNVVILDKGGDLPFAQTRGQRLLHLIRHLDERSSIIVTPDWPPVFGEAKMTPALFNRHTHPGEIVVTGKES